MLAFAFLGLTGYWAYLALAGVMFGLSILGGVVLAAKAPEADDAVEGPASRKWNPRTTQQEGFARPRAYGKNMHPGNIIAKWTDVDGDDREILYLLIDHGDGPTKGVVAPIADNTFLNNQPASNFGDSVSVQERTGTFDQTCMAGFEKPKLGYKQNIELLKDEEHIWTTPNTFFDDIEYTLFFPYGIVRNRSDGSHDSSSVTHLVRIREHPAGGWTTIYNTSISKKRMEPYFVNFAVSDLGFNCVRGKQYDLSITRTTGNATTKHTNNSFFRSVREVVDTEFTHPGKALVGIKAIATTKLSGNVDVKVIREDRIIRNVITGVLEYNNNRANVTYDELSLPVIGGNGAGTPYYLVRYDGIDPQYLDSNFFSAWAAFCDEAIDDGYGSTEPRCACNLIINEFTDIFSLAQDMAAVGRAYIYWSGSLLTGWIDDVVTTPIDLVTMDSMMSKTWKNSWAVVPELAGKVEVFYEDESQGYERTKAEWNSDDIDNYQNPVTVEGVGLKTRGTAVHYAHYLLTRNYLIRNTNKFRVHKDGFRYKLGHVIRLQCRIANWGSAFRVVSSTADTITVDRDVTAEVNIGDVIHIRTYNTAISAIVIDTYEVDSVLGRVITATINWDVTPVKGNQVAVGPAGAIKLRRITKLTPTLDNYFNVEVETYDVVLFDADDLNPANPNTGYIWPGLTAPLDEPLTQATVQDMLNRSIPPDPVIDVPLPANLTWNDDTPNGDSISWSKTDADEDIIFRLKGTSHIITAGNTDKEFVYWKPSAPTVFTTTDVFPYAELSAGSWLMCRNITGTAYPSTPMQTIHAGLIQVGTITAAYGQIADAAITTAKIAALAVETAKIKDLNVSTIKIAGDAVTLGVSAYTDASTVASDIQTVGITTTGLPVTIIGTVRIEFDAPGVGEYELKIIRGVTTIYTTGDIPISEGYHMVTVAFRETPGADTYTYKLNLTGTNIEGAKRFLYVQEVKK